MTRRFLTIPIACAALAALTTAASTHAQRRPCVEETTPPPTSGEQAECWYGRHDYAQAAAWCERADLSDEASGNLCFTAYVRSGRFEDAARVAGTLERVRPAVRTCHEAFTSGLRVRIVPNPASGVVTVDDEAYGRGAAEVMLSPPFWDHRMSVRFGARTVRVSEQRVRRALDPETCAARDVVVESEGGASGGGGGAPVAGIVLMAAGGAAAVGGGVMLLIAEGNARDVHDAETGSAWSDVEGAHDSVTPLRVVGGVLLGVGGGAAVAGLAITLGIFGGDDGETQADARVDVGPSGVRLRGRF